MKRFASYIQGRKLRGQEVPDAWDCAGLSTKSLRTLTVGLHLEEGGREQSVCRERRFQSQATQENERE